MFRKGIEIEGIFYPLTEILAMSVEQQKTLISFIESENDLEHLRAASDNDIIVFHIDRLLSNVNRQMNKYVAQHKTNK